MTKYAKLYDAPGAEPDEERIVTLDEARAIGGILGPIVVAMLRRHGVYGYHEAGTGRRILYRLAK